MQISVELCSESNTILKCKNKLSLNTIKTKIGGDIFLLVSKKSICSQIQMPT